MTDAPAIAARSRGGRLRPVAFAAAVVLVVVLARTFAAEPFAIPSSSMEPTLRPGDQVLVEKLSYRLGAPHRGDLAVFAEPGDGTLVLKRVVALAGDRVGIEDGALVVDGDPVREPFVDQSRVDSEYFGPVVVPAGRLFVLGDNRAESSDSRNYGTVAERDLIGRVLVRFWPPRG